MLLILGNGFDIQCGLKTDYKSFFDKRYSNDKFIKITDYFQNYETTIVSKNVDKKIEELTIQANRIINSTSGDLFESISVWDFIFIYEKISKGNDGWHFVENLIFHYIANNRLTYKGIIGTNQKLDERSVNKANKLECILYFLFNEIKMKFSPMQFNEWMLEQLKIIEEAFRLYVQQEINQKEFEYYDKSRTLYSHFVQVNDFDSKPLSIINFNYTIPRLIDNSYVQSTNIHGNIQKGEIIFGIDEKNSTNKTWIEPGDTKYLFTKTARKIHSNDNDENFKLNKYNDSNIFIYGHSLNDQDYSYFQSIFDAYNISESRTILFVGWTNYDKTKKLRADKVNSLIQLLKYYGDSMNNDRGKNLLHRLLLEKRIRVIEIPSISKT